MRKTLSVLLVLVLILSLFSACGNGENSPAPGSSGSTVNTSSAAPQQNSGGAGGGENVVTIGRNIDASTLDRFKVTEGPSFIYGMMMNDSLITLKTDGSGSYSPSLAKSWEVSEDGSAITFKLNTGVKFHNGDILTSADVKYTFERFAKDSTSRSIFDWTTLKSVETPDAETAILVFNGPFAPALSQVAFTYIVDKKVCEELGDKAWEKPVGSGPWKFESWTPGQEIVFTRNDDYWNWGSNKSNVDKVVIKIISDASTSLAAIQTGLVDVVEPLNVDQVKQLESYKNVKIEDTLNSGSVYFYFRTVGIFKDKNVRKAFSLAIDRKSIVETIVGGGKATAWPIDSVSMGYKDIEPEYDPDQAADLLKNSSYKGEEFKIIAVTGQVPRITEVLQAVSSMLNQVGFKSSVEFLDYAAFSDRRIAGNYDVYFASARTSAGDNGSTLITRWLNDQFKSGYVNEEINALIKQQAVEMDIEARNKLFQQIFQLAYDEVAPCTNAYQLNTISAYKDNISGIVFKPNSYTDFSRVMKAN